MLLFNGFDPFFYVLSLYCPLEGFLLFENDRIGLREKCFNLLFVGVLNAGVHQRILFVFHVQVEDHLRELGDLLRHLMMCFLG